MEKSDPPRQASPDAPEKSDAEPPNTGLEDANEAVRSLLRKALVQLDRDRQHSAAIGVAPTLEHLGEPPQSTADLMAWLDACEEGATTRMPPA